MAMRELSYFSVEPHLFILRVFGYYQIDPKSPKLLRLLHKVYMRLTLLFVVVYTLQQAIRVYQIRDDIDEVMGTLFLFLTHTDSIYKQIIMWIRADKIEVILNTMRGPLYNQGEADHRDCLSQTARQGKLLLRINNTMAVATCFLWVLYPLILHIQEKHVEFAIWLPFDANTNPQFYLAAIYIWIMTSWLAICNTAIDVMVAFLLAQCKTQLHILRIDLTKLVQKSEKEFIFEKRLYPSISYEDIVSRRFEKNIKHHKEIVQYAKQIQEIFGGAIAYQFLVSGWIICTSVYKMVQLDPLSVQFLSMIMYILCILMQLFLYCYYGNQVTHESEMLTYSAYAMNWLRMSLKHRRYLIIFMERIKCSIQLLAGFIIPLSNNTFLTIVRSSYTFYAILKNVNE